MLLHGLINGKMPLKAEIRIWKHPEIVAMPLTKVPHVRGLLR
jgi:hypothetical protein